MTEIDIIFIWLYMRYCKKTNDCMDLYTKL